jgi:hypothetical protein
MCAAVEVQNRRATGTSVFHHCHVHLALREGWARRQWKGVAAVCRPFHLDRVHDWHFILRKAGSLTLITLCVSLA